jgi:hypothetical protein
MAPKQHEIVPILFSQHQLRKIARSHVVQLKPHQIHNAKGVPVRLPRRIVGRLATAKRNNRGIRIQLSAPEIEGSGILDWLKNAGQWVKQNIIDQPFYQSVAKPLVRQLVDTGVNLVAPRLGPAENLVRRGVAAIGEKTGAYGLRRHMVKGSAEAKEWGRQMAAAKRAHGGSFRAVGRSGSFLAV